MPGSNYRCIRNVSTSWSETSG